jgi:hypothetical protein
MKDWLFNFQGIYYVLAGIWPVFDIHSFMLVTGPKTDIWLVKTVGLLSFSIGLSLLFLKKYRIPPVLNGLSAMSFLLIDVYYASIDRISNIYLADAVLELIFIVGAIIMFIRQRDDLTSGQRVTR